MADTVNDLFFKTTETRRRPDCLLTRRGDAIEALSTDEVATRVRRLALALAQLGVRPGERVGLLSYNRPEWAICDYGIQTAGAVTVPIYTTLPPEEIAFILEDAQARAIVVENAEQAAKIDAIRPKLPHLQWVIGIHGGGREIISLAELLQRGVIGTQRDHRRLADAVRPDDLATILYTSGTTGIPKGVMLTHANLTANSAAAVPALGLRQDDRTVSFLPLSHIFQRQIDLSLFGQGCTIAYATAIAEVAADLPLFCPTVLASVPRVLEKIHQSILERVGRSGPHRRRFFERSMAAAREAATLEREGRPVSLGLRWRRAWGERLIFRKIRARLGGHLRFVISGGAPLAPELAEFFWAVGIPVLQGYGLTETSPVISTNTLEANRIGTVGRVIPGHQVRLAEDGEILFRGPSLMRGYYRRDDATAEAIRDGWFHTGDIGELDADGFLRVTDRKKDLFKTSGGKYIAPQPLEKKLMQHPAVQNALVVGAGRKFAGVLIVPNLERLEADLGPAPSRAELLKDARVLAEFDRALAAVNDGLPGYATLKKFALLERDFTIEAGEMTPTFKIKRRVVEERYRSIIDQMYADAP
jgi:long-chain acyl-CoA synthetase